MANNNIPRGLIPYRDAYDGYRTGGMGLYFIPATDANNIFVGDPMVPTGASDRYGIPVVARATAGAGNPILGPMVAVAPGGPNTQVIAVTRDIPVYRPGGTAQYVLIDHDPDSLFMIQDDSGGVLGPSPIPIATVGMKNANLLAGAGSTFTGYSGWQLNSATVAAATPTAQLRIMRLLMQEDNEGGLAHAKWLVKINLHVLLEPNGI